MEHEGVSDENNPNVEGTRKKGITPSNYRQITCLPMIRKIVAE